MDAVARRLRADVMLEQELSGQVFDYMAMSAFRGRCDELTPSMVQALAERRRVRHGSAQSLTHAIAERTTWCRTPAPRDPRLP